MQPNNPTLCHYLRLNPLSSQTAIVPLKATVLKTMLLTITREKAKGGPHRLLAVLTVGTSLHRIQEWGKPPEAPRAIRLDSGAELGQTHSIAAESV